jgi:hypothetical protein
MIGKKSSSSVKQFGEGDRQVKLGSRSDHRWQYSCCCCSMALKLCA